MTRPRQVTEDEQLVAAALAGDEAAFGELVDRYQHRLLRFLLTRCRSRADAEDALQDAFLNAYRYLASYRSRWQFSTWLYRIAIREAARQSPKAAPESELPAVVEPLAACIAAGERENLWLTAQRELSAEAHAALWLRYAEEMPLQQVANVLGRTVTWVKVSLHRSRRRLRAALGDDSEAGTKREAYG